MSIFNVQDIITLFDLIKRRVKPEEVYKLTYNTLLWQMFRQFGVENEEQRACLSSIFEKSFDTEGLSQRGAYLVSYVHKIFEREDEIEEFLNNLCKEENFIIEEAKKRAAEYLPKNALFTDLEIFFIPTPNDARVDYKKIYFDPLLAVNIGKEGFINALSHEFHHVGRMSITKEENTNINTLSELIFLIFQRLEMEGIADCVFDFSNLPGFKKLKEEREKIFKNYDKYLERTQKILIGMITKEITLKDGFEKVKNTLFMHNEYHPVGHRMACEIMDELGKKKLIECVGDPVKFVSYYQNVAVSRGTSKIDEKIIREIKGMK